MERYSWQEAQQHLKKLLADAQHGKTIFILDEHEQLVQLVPVPEATQGRKAGSARGQVQMSEDFDAPLDDFAEYMA